MNKEERLRYSRNISVDGIGAAGQERLMAASVCIIGCGALGSVAAAYLAGAGVGRITLADFDNVDISNLQRQLTFSEADCGQPKARVLADRLAQINSGVEVNIIDTLVTAATIDTLVSGHDLVIDASDNPDTKYIIDDACARANIACTIAGVLGTNGQVMTCAPGTARYRDFFPESAGAGYTPCSIGGVLGPVPGIIGSIQALEAIKSITGCGHLLTDRMLMFDGREMRFTQISM